MTTKKTKHYINNADFLAALVEYQKSCDIAKKEKKEDPPIPNYLGECFLKIAEHLSRKPNFISYSFRDEMIADGIENCLMYFRNFDPVKSNNPFAYFTQIIYYAFLRRIQKEKKQLYVKYKATEQIGILDEFEMFEDADGHQNNFNCMITSLSSYKLSKKTNARKKKANQKGWKNS